MKVLVWGAGAIGGSIGAYLARAAHEVTFVDVVEEHVSFIRANGLQITGPIDEFTVQVAAFTPDELVGQWQAILLCTKAHHTEAATRALLPHLAADGYVVSVQNGLNERIIGEIVGRERTLGCFINFGADYLAPGVIHYAGRGAVVLGELDGSKSKRLDHLHQLFLNFDNKAITTGNIWGYLWGKMGYGAMLFATALTNASIADALAAQAYREVFKEVAREVMRVVAAQGIQPEGFNGYNPSAFVPEASDALAETSLDEMVAFNRQSAKTHSGIWRDLVVRKRKTEVDAHLGMVVKVAKELGVATPLCVEIVRQIHEIEAGKRELSWENLERLKQMLSPSQ